MTCRGNKEIVMEYRFDDASDGVNITITLRKEMQTYTLTMQGMYIIIGQVVCIDYV